MFKVMDYLQVINLISLNGQCHEEHVYKKHHQPSVVLQIALHTMIDLVNPWQRGQDYTCSSGGILLYVRSDIAHRRIRKFECNFDGIESICMELNLGKTMKQRQ